jgi:hypothetical protein
MLFTTPTATHGLRRLSERAQESAAHSLSVPEAGRFCDVFDRVPALQHDPGSLDAQVLDGFSRRLACLGPKGSGELSRAEVSSLGELFDRQASAEVLPGVGERHLDPIRLRLELEERGELRLSAPATVEDDECLRDLPSEVRAKVNLDHGEREIDAGSHPCRRPDGAVGDINPILFDPDLRVAILQLTGM